MRLKMLIYAILIFIHSISGVSYYSSTDIEKYNLVVENILKYIKHVSKVRDDIEISQAIRWYFVYFQKNNPALTKCIIEGTKYLYIGPEFNPSKIRISYERKIYKRKSQWLVQIKTKKK